MDIKNDCVALLRLGYTLRPNVVDIGESWTGARRRPCTDVPFPPVPSPLVVALFATVTAVDDKGSGCKTVMNVNGTIPCFIGGQEYNIPITM